MFLCSVHQSGAKISDLVSLGQSKSNLQLEDQDSPCIYLGPYRKMNGHNLLNSQRLLLLLDMKLSSLKVRCDFSR